MVDETRDVRSNTTCCSCCVSRTCSEAVGTREGHRAWSCVATTLRRVRGAASPQHTGTGEDAKDAKVLTQVSLTGDLCSDHEKGCPCALRAQAAGMKSKEDLGKVRDEGSTAGAGKHNMIEMRSSFLDVHGEVTVWRR